MKKKIFICLLFVCPLLAQASIDKSSLTLKEIKNRELPLSEIRQSVFLALRIPFENRLQALSALGPLGLKELEVLSFDQSQTLSVRWKSLTALARLQGQKTLPILEQAMQRPEWFMRNAAVIAALNLDRKWAMEWSKKLLEDEALVVRTSAVQNLIALGGRDAKELLWQELYSPKNFRSGNSLWIRRHIAKALSNMATPSETFRFSKLLEDQDKRIHPWAVVGLEKSTGRFLGAQGSPISEKRRLWLAQLGPSK